MLHLRRTCVQHVARTAVVARPLFAFSSAIRTPSSVSSSSLASYSFSFTRTFAVTPAYERRSNTSELLDFEAGRKDLKKWKKQLLYRSKQRGWLELDLIMGTWAEENLDKLDQTNLEHYARVVASENPDLIKYFVERMPLPTELASNPIAHQLVDYAQTQKKAWTATVQSGNQ